MGVENLAFITCCQARKFKLPLRKKCLNTEFFLVRMLFSPNAEKYGPEKTPYLGTFHVVFFSATGILGTSIIKVSKL